MIFLFENRQTMTQWHKENARYLEVGDSTPVPSTQLRIREVLLHTEGIIQSFVIRIQYGEAKLSLPIYIKGLNFASPYCIIYKIKLRHSVIIYNFS